MTASDLLNFVFACAIDDRRSLADGIRDRDDPMRKEALEDCRKFEALRDKLLPIRGPANMREWLQSQTGPFEVITPTTPEGKARLREISENAQGDGRRDGGPTSPPTSSPFHPPSC